MPTYEYACKACGHRLEAVQKFSDEALTVCPQCDGALRKIFAAPGIVLKGSGFYKTDTRAPNKPSAGDKTEGNGSSTPADAPSTPSPAPASTSESTTSGSGSSAPAKDPKPAASAAT